MKRIFASIALASLAFAPVAADSWSVVGAQVLKSIVEVENTDGRCTAFVIDSEGKDNTDILMSAAHCDGKELFADHSPAKVIAKDAKFDFLILSIEDTGRPALKLAKKNALTGDEVMSYGYGYALDRPLLRVTHISDDNTYIPEGGVGGPFMIVDTSFVPGQSGGPVVNTAGDVVMLVQMGNDVVGLGRGAEAIKSRVGKYFAKPAAK